MTLDKNKPIARLAFRTLRYCTLFGSVLCLTLETPAISVAPLVPELTRSFAPVAPDLHLAANSSADFGLERAGLYEIISTTTIYVDANEASTKVADLTSGTKVNVVAFRGDWLEVRSRFGRPPGFIKKDSAKPVASTVSDAMSPTPPAVSGAAGPGVGAYELVHTTTVYVEARANSSVVTHLPAGTRINVVAVQEDWLEIRSRQGRPPGFIKRDSARPIVGSSSVSERIGTSPLDARQARAQNFVLSKSSRLPEECAIATRVLNPPGFGYEKIDPNLAAQLRKTQMPTDAWRDPRFLKAELLDEQGLSDEGFKLWLELLCDWPDSRSKSAVLERLSANRIGVGSIEEAIWATERRFKNGMLEAHWQPSHYILDHIGIGKWYADLGDFENAKKKISEIEAILRSPRAEENFSIGVVYPVLAELYFKLGDNGRAQQLVKTIEGTATATTRDRPSGWAFARLAEAYFDAGEEGAAKKLALTALDYENSEPRPDGFTDLPHIFQVLADIAIKERNGSAALLYLADYEKQTALNQKRLKVAADEYRDRQSPEEYRQQAEYFSALAGAVAYEQRAKIAWLYGKAYALLGKQKDSLVKFLEAVELIENLRGFTGAKERLQFFAQYTGPYQSLVESLLDQRENPLDADLKGLSAKGRSNADGAFYYAEAARARSLSEQIASSRDVGAEKLSPDLLQRERELFGKARAELRDGTPFQKSSSYREVQLFVDNLRETHPDYATLKYPIPVTVSDIPLRDNESLLVYSVLEKRLAVWLLQKAKTARVFLIPVARDDLVKAIRALRISLEPQGDGWLLPFDNQSSDNLYQWLLAEPLKSIARGSKILIIPDGPLSTIPFDVLGAQRPDGTPDFAGSRYTFSYAPSATVLAFERRYPASRQASAPKGKILAIGDPVYDGKDVRANDLASGNELVLASRSAALRSYFRNHGFAPLPGTELEIKQIGAALGYAKSIDIRLGKDANEHGLKTVDLSAYQFLHFATHGVLADEIPYLKQPALVFSQFGNPPGEDGFLTMEEVMNLKLNADLTVLSACQTGLGKEVSGEGVLGLARAFLYAGSRSVIVSLWKVADESTAILMGRLYNHVAKGIPFAQALSQAKEEVRKTQGGRFAHPFFWAPFIIFGSD